MSQPTLSPKDARDILWRKGNLSFKLHTTQKEIYQFIHENKNRKVVISSSRRLGKSFLLCVMAIEQCLQKPNSIVKFIAPEVKQVRTIIRPIMRDVLKGCPGELRPEYKTNEHLYRFPNGSEIQLAGSDNGNAENLRGGNSHLCIIDEAGFCSDLEYVIQSILLPTTTTTKGKVILASTPPKSPDHEFVNFVKEAELKGALIKKSIYDNPLITSEDIQEMIEASGGSDTIQFRREYMAEIIKDDNYAIIPEFTAEMKNRVVRDWQRPPYFDCYTAMDIGFKDLTVALFAYLDFRSSKLVIEDELVMSGKKMTTDILADGVKKKEQEVWLDKLTGESQKPFIRVSDNNLIVLNDLQQLHNLTFLPTNKDNADAALNFLRMLIGQEKIIINPRCKTLIFHLENGVWNKNRTSFERSADSGHYDACFIPGSKVITDTGIKNIEDINQNDLVLTHKGNYKKVKANLSREYEGDILNLKIENCNVITCTPDHKFDAFKIQKNCLPNLNNTFWVEAKYLNVNQYLVHSPNKESNGDFRTIQEKTNQNYKGNVYSLEVEDDHSYTVNGIAVKNCDALKYLVRNVNFNKNPYPSNYNMPSRDSIFQQKATIDQRNLYDNIKTWFKPKK